MMTSTTTARLDSLTGLRWFAALAVFGCHAVRVTTTADWLLWPGAVGVAFFFALSGFVLAWSAQPDDTTRAFYRRRFARIWPVYLVSLAAAMLLMYAPDTPWLTDRHLQMQFALCLVLLQAWVTWDLTTYYAGNFVAWSLTHEVSFYAAFPLQRRVHLGARGWLLVAAGSLLWPLLGAVVLRVTGHLEVRDPFAAFFFRSPIGTVSSFIAGLALARAMLLGWRPRWDAREGLAAVVVTWSAIVVVGVHWPDAQRLVGEYLLFPVAAPAFLSLIAGVAAREVDGGRSWLAARPLVALGAWSYAFYLIHAIVLTQLHSIKGVSLDGWQGAAVVALGLALSVLLAALLHRWVERPLEARLRGRQDVDVRASATSNVRL